MTRKQQPKRAGDGPAKLFKSKEKYTGTREEVDEL